jgi:hypothetical protein
MMRLSQSLLCVVLWTLFLGACGPAFEAEGSSDFGATVQGSNAGDLGRALGAPVAVYSNTCAASNQWRTTCGSGITRDISYTWAVPAAGTYSFTTRGSNFDTVLEIRDYRNTSQVLGCDSDAGTRPYSSLTLNLTAGQILLMTIEGYEGVCGRALLNITRR